MEARPEHLLKRARERFDAGDPHGAILLLRDFVATGEAFADAYNLLGLSHAMIGQHQEALVQFEVALNLNPSYVDALLNRAVVLNELGRSAEAAEAFSRAQELGATDTTGFSAPIASRLANLHADLADAYLEAGGRAQALQQLEAAVALRPGFADLRYRLARLLLDGAQTERARAELETILGLRPRFTQARAALGMACYLLKDLAAARSHWEQCRVEMPDDPKVSAYLALLARVGG